jgi:hypothetical protein
MPGRTVHQGFADIFEIESLLGHRSGSAARLVADPDAPSGPPGGLAKRVKAL